MQIEIGNIKLESNVILAPMSGVTDPPYRRLVKKFGAGLVVSEMIASKAMVLKEKENFKKAGCFDAEATYPMSVQLAGCEPDVMRDAAKLNEDKGAHIIDINYGCPVKKVTQGQFSGSAMMKDEKLAAEVLKATVEAVKIPVTLKMRMGWDHSNLNAPKLAKIAEDLGIKMITIHGRTRNQFYTGKANWEFINSVKDAVKIPVVANGDICNVNDAVKALQLSKADGVMIGRGAYGKPWIINQTAKYLETGELIAPPSLEEQVEYVVQHYEETLSHYGATQGARVAKKHIGWYSAGLPGSADFRNTVFREDNPQVVIAMIKEFFGKLIAEGFDYAEFSLKNTKIEEPTDEETCYLDAA